MHARRPARVGLTVGLTTDGNKLMASRRFVHCVALGAWRTQCKFVIESNRTKNRVVQDRVRIVGGRGVGD